MNLTLLFFVFFHSTAQAESIAQMCSGSSPLESNSNQIIEVCKQAMMQDIAGFCEETAWGIVPYVEGMSYLVAEKDRDDIAKIKLAAEKIPTDWLQPWQNSLVPNLKMKSVIFQNGNTSLKNLAYPVDKMREMILTPNENLSSLKDTVEDSSARGMIAVSKSKSLSFDGDIANSAIVRSVVCSDITVKDNMDCTSALGKIVEFSRPSAENITPVSIYHELLTKPQYIEGTKKAALKILERFEKDSVPQGANLFEDIRLSFIESGMKDVEAQDAAWNVLAIVASGGPNTGTRMRVVKTDAQFYSMKVALAAIAMAIPKLDFQSVKDGHPYSMPAEIKTTCDIGKPYHFWMTAFLARKMVRAGFSASGSAAAAFVTQKGYEMKSTTSGRDPSRAFMVEAFSPWNNMMRIDTGFSAAAAVFGANSAKKITREINLDEGIKKIIGAGKMYPTMTKAEADAFWAKKSFGLGPPGRDGYNRWQEIIAADTGFLYQRQFLGN